MTSKTIIDVLLHNQDLITNTKVVCCPFSDHRFILANFKIHNKPPIQTIQTCRHLTITKIKTD
jgi:hypothetical protein